MLCCCFAPVHLVRDYLTTGLRLSHVCLESISISPDWFESISRHGGRLQTAHISCAYLALESWLSNHGDPQPGKVGVHDKMKASIVKDISIQQHVVIVAH